MTKIEEVEKVKESPKFLQAVSAVMNTSEIAMNNIWGANSGLAFIDKMEIPKDYYKQVDTCRFFFLRDPIVSGTINKQIEIAFNDLKPRQGNTKDEEFEVYKYCNDVILEAMKIVSMEYLVSGLIVPEIAWKTVTGKEIGLKNRPNRRYEIPDYIWLRPCENLVIKPTPIPGRIRIFAKVSMEDIFFLKNNGQYMDGTKDVDLYKQILQDYPDYVKRVQNGETEIELSDHFSIRRKVQAGSIFPTPYLLPALESLMHKRNLKKMDYSIASRVIGAIQLITLGDKDFPLTEDDKDSLDDLKEQMRWRSSPGNMERVFQLFGNHTIKISWIYPDTSAMLDEGKYSSVNHDILYALGIPNIITTGENLRSASSQAEFALLPPAETLRNLRNEIIPFVKYIYNQIMDKNGFMDIAKPKMSPIRLYDPAKMATIGETLYNNGALSKTTWDELTVMDLEFGDELVQRKADDSETKRLGLEPSPQVPYSSPSIGAPKPPSPSTKSPSKTPATTKN
jgi:hypothetical protein